jgi:hypothetical protein
MPDGCPDAAPVELADGRIVRPEDAVTLADICEIVPLILETMSQAAAQQNGPTPGAAVPLANGIPTQYGQLPTQAGAFGRPGALTGPALGPTYGPGGGGPRGGGGGGFVSSGGGGRGGPGPQGPPGTIGPPGPGAIAPPLVKTDGNFTVPSVSPFVPVPGASIMFTQERDGNAAVFVQGVFGGNSVAGEANGQLGLRIDGVDHPLTGNLLHTGAPGVDQFLVGVHSSFAVALAAGAHTVEVVVRGDASLGAPTGTPVTVQANPTVPLALTVIHG